jgi:ribosome-associated protein
MSHTILDDLKCVAAALSDKKGQNIMIIDVRGISSMTDYFCIADGSVERHVLALADHVEEELQKRGVFPLRREGESVGDWVVLDYGDFIIHIFETELRDKYRLEELWKEGKLVH